IKTWHWKDGVVGKQITCTGHDENIFTICGVSKNIRWGAAVETGDDGMNEFPDLYFYSVKPAYYMLVKFNKLKDESLSELQSKVQAMYPNNKVIVKNYASELANQYASQLNFRNGILVAGIVTMIIALFGLVGYTSDEVNRRRKEIAIRKVNGAKVKDILRIFLKDIMKMALPCIIVGDIGAWLIARQWLMSFSEKITITPLLFICVTILLLVIIALSVIINCYKVANSNPVKYLKDE
ncbi:ABC transporter permease, partial [Prevotella sp.]|uniref:ABC transporter permease n=2 Tax=Prevotella sp. TaxID=59823 RepID=UPI003FEFF711